MLPAHFQARQVFSDQVIAQLALSMNEVGQNTPLLVRPAAAPAGTTDSEEWFELVCGECRVRAAKLLGWKTLWAVIEAMTDESAALRGMVDNKQRKSLNLIERATGYRKLMTEYDLTQTAGLRETLSYLQISQHARESRGPDTTSVRDDRITGVGHFIRRYKLDELPQLINVLLDSARKIAPTAEVRA